MDARLAQTVRARANAICEYCLLPQRVRRLKFHVEHIIPRKHRGTDDLDNLALACGRSNRHKGPNLSGIDPMTGAKVDLYNPRHDRWSEHFRWDGSHIVGVDPIGRATVEVLAMNHAEEIALREQLIHGGYFPPVLPS